MLGQIGFLDDDFFFNHEDTDLNMRAWLSGWKCTYVPEAIVYHKVSATVGELSDTSVYFFARNNEWVWIKNVPTRFLFLTFISRIIYEVGSVWYYCVKNRKWKPFMRGKFDAVKKIPAMLIKRRQIQKLVKLEPREISHSLVPIAKYLLLRLQKSK
jgi:GT2 family glycosyltransferase